MKYKLSVSPIGKFFTVPVGAVENYLKLADGDFYKVLLSVLCINGNSFDTEQIAAQCGLSNAAVSDAVLFWAQNGVLDITSLDGENVRIAAGSEVFTDSSDKRKTETSLPVCRAEAVRHTLRPETKAVVRYSPKDLAKKAEDDSAIKTLYEETEKIFGRLINGTDSAGLVNIYEYYGLSVPSILILAQYCHDIGKDRVAYMETVAADWYGRGICDYLQVEREIERLTAQNSYNNKVAAALGIEGKITKKQSEFFSQWHEWGFDTDTIGLAGERCRDKKNKTDIKYINGILKNWKKDELYTVDAVEQSENAYRIKKEEENTPSFDLRAWREMAMAANTVSDDGEAGEN